MLQLGEYTAQARGAYISDGLDFQFLLGGHLVPKGSWSRTGLAAKEIEILVFCIIEDHKRLYYDSNSFKALLPLTLGVKWLEAPANPCRIQHQPIKTTS
jgi:hypothetical protein